MARVTAENFGSGALPEMVEPTDNCFYCGRKLIGFPVVFWHGNDEKNQEIWMHANCAAKLALHLQSDAGVSPA